ncbi:MAG: hypothetical protein AVDCRST_MAG59-3361, partial [uncultured Thermomicrobiales bacterium]
VSRREFRRRRSSIHVPCLRPHRPRGERARRWKHPAGPEVAPRRRDRLPAGL